MPQPLSSKRSRSVAAVLFGVADNESFRYRTSLHGLLIKTRSHKDSIHGNAVVDLYGKHGRVADARLAFREIENRDIGSWNSLINAYSRLGLQGCTTVFELFRGVMAEVSGGMRPTSFTLTGAITASIRTSPSVGRQVHAVAMKTANYGDLFVGSSLLNMYCKLGLLSDARKVFDRMTERNFVTWATMISGYASEAYGDEAFRLLWLMLKEGDSVPNEFVITSVLSAASAVGSLENGEQVHCLAIKIGSYVFVPVMNALITMYTKCGCLEAAHQLFDSLSSRNSITWSAIVTGNIQNGFHSEGLSLFSQMHSAGFRPTEFAFVGVLNACSELGSALMGKQVHALLLKLGFDNHVYLRSALIDMYAKSANISDARKGFNYISNGDTVLWTTMITGYVQSGDNEEALLLYSKMAKEGVQPADLTLATILKACSCLTAYETGKQIHGHVIKYGFKLENPVGTALSTMYARCGDLDDSYLVFRRIPNKDTVAWNSIISGLVQNGRDSSALQLFPEMKLNSMVPDRVTFIHLLTACSHMGLVDKGWELFRSMVDDYGLTPSMEHYACVVDILCRAGLLEEALFFIESIPIDHGTYLWRIVLGASYNCRKFDTGAYSGERLMQLGTQDTSAYILLSNIYAASGQRREMERVRKKMKFCGGNKEPGCSWVAIDNTVHVFLVKDQRHPRISDINAEVQRLHENMKYEGYIAFLGPSFHGFTDLENGPSFHGFTDFENPEAEKRVKRGIFSWLVFVAKACWCSILSWGSDDGNREK